MSSDQVVEMKRRTAVTDRRYNQFLHTFPPAEGIQNKIHLGREIERIPLWEGREGC